jgi:hypothetical protein
MEAHYIGFNMWVKAVEKAGTTDTDKVEQAMLGITFPNLTGSTAKMIVNHHLSKPVFIGDIIIRLNKEQGLTVLLVEQKLHFARRVTDSFSIMEKGRIVAAGKIEALNEDVVQRYLTV